MTTPSEERVASVLAATMDSLEGERCTLPLATYRLLAQGSPVAVAALADATGISTAEIGSWLDSVSAVFRDGDGRIAAFWGLSIPPTPHRFEVGGVPLHTWCAWDTLFLPALIGEPARVRSSCPVSRAEVALTVSPQGVEDLSPAGATVSMLAPEDGFEENVLQSFCHHVHFFASPEAGERWLSDRRTNDAFLLTVAQAHRLGELWNAHRFGVGSATP